MLLIQELWYWYIDLYNNKDPKVVVATIAMTIAALTFIINFILKPLFKVIKRETAKVSIEVFTSLVTIGNRIVSVEIELVITNKSSNILYLNNPGLETSKKINGAKRHHTAAIRGTYPVLLQSGQPYKINYGSNNNIFRRLNPNDKVRFFVKDTIGRTYYSKYYKAKDFQN
jgi:hypothetical protein